MLSLVYALCCIVCAHFGACATHLSKNVCIALNSQDSVLQKHLCQEIGLEPCTSNPRVCSINSRIVRDATDRELCLRTLFGFFATISCERGTKTKDYIYSANMYSKHKKGDYESHSENGEFAIVYVSKNVAQSIWKACSPRAGRMFSDIMIDDEAKRFCKELTLNSSKVQIRQGEGIPCLSEILILRAEEIAELEWLLGGSITWGLIKSKSWGICIIIVMVLLAASSLYIKHGRKEKDEQENDHREEESETSNLIELDVNM
ncbi:uncharacterized protein BEWA_031350 [Theileria equi strain WA]|uniref:Membrane protein, putative n=1 Tax=Theileria equi strain WA TaxID=1537102 RepID=L0AXI2_THEEQ|nr:uncharacterized protein BEWA_031350 [Theileria equi strain WA]AFZ80282.1 membrane protein, putative [Theileria equi strain WA]|eukprot:XP_004829948.1 uncharacterized protein BEWA_031350 [Theileria equi strain WA]